MTCPCRISAWCSRCRTGIPRCKAAQSGRRLRHRAAPALSRGQPGGARRRCSCTTRAATRSNSKRSATSRDSCSQIRLPGGFHALRKTDVRGRRLPARHAPPLPPRGPPTPRSETWSRNVPPPRSRTARTSAEPGTVEPRDAHRRAHRRRTRNSESRPDRRRAYRRRRHLKGGLPGAHDRRARGHRRAAGHRGLGLPVHESAGTGTTYTRQRRQASRMPAGHDVHTARAARHGGGATRLDARPPAGHR